MIYFLFFLLTTICTQAFEVHGHRGCRGTRPENTIAAFEAAIIAKVDVLEMDLQMSSDGVFVIHHDYDINGQLIKNLPLSQIKEIDCGSTYNPEFPEQILSPAQIPTLQEVFDFVKDKTIRLNLEIKRDPLLPHLSMPAFDLAQRLVHLVKAHGFTDRIYYSSFDPEVLIQIRKLSPDARIIFIVSEKSLSVAQKYSPHNPFGLIAKVASSFKAEAIELYHVFLDDHTFSLFKNAGFRIIPWIVNDPTNVNELIQMGVDGIISDYPQEILCKK